MDKRIARWGQGPFLGLDFEATAANPLEARPIQYCLSYVEFDPSGKARVDTTTSYINPGVEVPEDSIKIHGISNEIVKENGEDPKEAINAINQVIAKVLVDGGSLVIMNAAYDLTLLDREASRQGLVPLSEMSFSGYRGRVVPVIDPMIIDKRFNKFRKRVSETQGARCLKTIAQVYGLPWDDSKAHDAEYDTLQTVRVAVKMAKVVTSDASAFMARGWSKQDTMNAVETRNMTAEDLHHHEIKWAAAQSEDLRRYFLKVGNQEAADSVHGEWPYIMPKDEGLF